MSAVEDQGFATVTEASTEDAARFLVDNDDVAAVVLFRSDLSVSVPTNQPSSSSSPTLTTGSAHVAEVITTAYAEEINAVRLSVATACSTSGPTRPTSR